MSRGPLQKRGVPSSTRPRGTRQSWRCRPRERPLGRWGAVGTQHRSATHTTTPQAHTLHTTHLHTPTHTTPPPPPHTPPPTHTHPHPHTHTPPPDTHTHTHRDGWRF